ncbi:CYFA0S15e00342g1_1 [Cyberlindnera fabianii]|uniref:CYFA0S15e00342g1_1 n=1 Tax=Cyberlindnera fabianii TaxID=36022 RepID=A0A061BCC3_CYBFA|nr:CYFA0S15e00342g1_1 [Cyberlindnera fabianii]
MAITSPFRKISHSRDNSREESHPISAPVQRGAPQQLQGGSYGRAQAGSHGGSRSNSGRTAGMAPMVPMSRDPASSLKKSNTVTSNASATSTASASLARQYDSDKQRLIKYCFSTQDKDGVVIDSYITHVRVIEDSAYPSAKPPSSSPQSNKKPRILALAVKRDGSVHLHKGRENSNGSFQIGRTWPLSELSMIAREPTAECGFLCRLGKDYYWETNTPRERQVFVTSFVRVYRKFKNGMVPQLINWDLSLFGLDEKSYKASINRDIIRESSDRKKSVTSQSSKSDKLSRSTTVPTTESPSIVKVPSPKKPSAKSSSSSPAINTPPLSSSSLSQNADPYASTKAKQTSMPPPDFTTRRPSAPSSSARRPSTDSRQRRPSVESGPRRPSVDSAPRLPSETNQNKASSVSSSPKKEQFIPPAVETPSADFMPSPVESTKPLDFNRPSRQASQTLSKDLPTDSRNVSSDKPQLDLEQEINEQMKKLGLGEPVDTPLSSKTLDAQAALDIPQRYDPSSDGASIDRTATGSSAFSVSQTLKSVEIVAHRRSMQDIENEQRSDEDDDDDDDDITALYHDSDENMDSSVIHPEKEEPVPFPTTPHDESNDSQDFSFENSYDEQEPSYEKINVTPKAPPYVDTTPATIKVHVQSDNEDGYDDLNTPVDTLDLPKPGRTRRRANTMESALEVQEAERSTFDDIFDEINWDMDDDAETLTYKLMKELADTEYDTTKKLIDLRGRSANLEQYTSKIHEECSKLTPMLNFFTVELSGFARDIQHVESEGQGLQVETINKKHLWNDLQNLLNTVSVDEKSLNVVLTANIDRDLRSLEPVLAELESAINAIRGDDKGEDQDLGDMKALKDRRAKYESVSVQFMRNMKIELEKRFVYTVRSLDDNSTDRDILRALSKLLVYASITQFIRDIADESFYDLVGSWESIAAPLYENVVQRVNDLVVERTKKDQKFTLSSYTAFKPSILPVITKKLSSEDKESRLRERFGLSEPSTPKEAEVPSVETADDEMSLYHASLRTVLNHVILQQDFLVKFFHMSSAEPDLAKYLMKYPIESRESLLNSSIGEIDFDRTNARDISSSISAMFQGPLDRLHKSIAQGLRTNQKNTPGVMLWLELFEKKFAASNQEYLLGQFKKLSDRLSVDWAKFVDLENKSIEKTVLAHRNTREIHIIVKNFTKFVIETEKSFAKILAEYPINGVVIKDLESGKHADNAYVELSRSIVMNLSQGYEEKFSRFKLHEASEMKDKRNHLVNLAQNSNWIIESLTPLKLPSLNGNIAELQRVFSESRDQYVHMLVNQNFGKIASFVHDVQGLLKETAPKSIDPSKRNAYSKATLSKLLSSYTIRDVNKIVNDMRQEVVKHFKDPEESEIQRQLIDKIWSSLQAEFVSITMGLASITERYYRDVEQHFYKKDIIAAFNSARISH